jgi:hypothetical protein
MSREGRKGRESIYAAPRREGIFLAVYSICSLTRNRDARHDLCDL